MINDGTTSDAGDPRPFAREAISGEQGAASEPQPIANGPASARSRGNWQVAGICALLVIMVFLVFGQTVGHRFVNFDDDHCVYENPVVSKGMSQGGVGWAFTHCEIGHWAPLTTLSHMADSQLYGLWAGGHHLTNVLLHAAAAVLLFLMLRAMTGALWRCAFVAALFAIHPLRVESVAWVTERKDVLSGVFFMLTLWAYARYARRPESRGRYAMVLAWFVIGLMSKSMLVTLPFVLLLLDYWPLKRFETGTGDAGWRAAWRLCVEKIPLLLVSAVFAVVQMNADRGQVVSIPLIQRAGNAVVSYMAYLGQMLWPANLAVFYPHPGGDLPAWETLLALAGLAILSAAVICGEGTAAVAGGGVVVVFGDAGACDRDGAVRGTGVRRPLHLFAADWTLLRRNLGSSGLGGSVPVSSYGGGVRGGGDFGGPHGVRL